MADTYTGIFRKGEKVFFRQVKLTPVEIVACLGTEGNLDYRIKPWPGAEADWLLREVREDALRPVPGHPENTIT